MSGLMDIFGDDNITSNSSPKFDRFYCHIDTNTHNLFIAFSTSVLCFGTQVEMLIRKPR